MLSFNGVSQTLGYKVEYQNWVEDAFRVTNARGNMHKFTPCKQGLYHWDTRVKVHSDKNKVKFKETTLEDALLAIVTVEGNKNNHSAKDMERAIHARDLQHKAGYLRDDQLMRIARNNHLMKSPVTPRCVVLKNKIYGPSILGLQGRTIRKKKEGVDPKPMDVSPIMTIKPRYKKVLLFADIMFVNGLAVLTTLLKHLHFGTAEGLTSASETGNHHLCITVICRDTPVGRSTICWHTEHLSKYKVTLNLTARDEH